MYGFGPYTGCPVPPSSFMPPVTSGPLPFGGASFAMTPFGYGVPIIGADAPAAAPSMLDKLKAKGEEETFGVKNKYLAGGGIALAVIAALAAKGML